MSLQAFLSHWPQWSDYQSNADSNVLAGFVSLSRNLHDFPFHHRSTLEKREAVRDRILQALQDHPDFRTAGFYTAAELGEEGIQLLAERFLCSYTLNSEDPSSGLLLSSDQNFALTINCENHLTLRFFSAGGQMEAAWNKAAAIATALHKQLPFAFHDDWGYLSPSLQQSGNGLQFTALLDMTAHTLLAGRLGEENIEQQVQAISEHLQLQSPTLGTAPRCHFSGAFGAGLELMAPKIEDAPCQCLYPGSTEHHSGASAPSSFLQVLTTKDSARKSEQYLSDSMEAALRLLREGNEKARVLLLEERGDFLAEYCRRCLVLIAHARYLGLKEGLTCLSVLRLAQKCGLLTGCKENVMAPLLFSMQRRHLSKSHGVAADDPFALAEARASLFRSVYDDVTLKGEG